MGLNVSDLLPAMLCIMWGSCGVSVCVQEHVHAAAAGQQSSSSGSGGSTTAASLPLRQQQQQQQANSRWQYEKGCWEAFHARDNATARFYKERRLVSATLLMPVCFMYVHGWGRGRRWGAEQYPFKKMDKD